MGQGYSLTTLSAGSAGIDVPELADLTYERSLGMARFMKSIRARHHDGLVVVKVVMKPYPNLKLDRYIQELIRERKALAEISNALAYDRILETGTNGYLIDDYVLIDRSTRPFLEDIEKKWLAFQLLCALRDSHSRNVYHGDIRSENILVTSWNWLYLADFSASFKPAYLPEDNPADFSYYFDTSGRRTCYLAPERFIDPGERPERTGKVNWAMDIFSAGCVIAELFLETSTFSLSQLYKYRKGEFDPEKGHLSRIEDRDIRELVMHMIQIEPESRYSADEYLNFWRRKAFPEYFYSFLHHYMGLITDPSSGRRPITAEDTNLGEADERIDRVYYDFDKISYFLGYDDDVDIVEVDSAEAVLDNVMIPVHIDIPNHRHKALRSRPPISDDGSLIFLALVVSSLRHTARATSRVRACDLLLAFAERITDEAKLDRILPYVVSLLNDPTNIVKAAAIRTLTQLMALIKVVSPANAHVFPEYILPRLQSAVFGPSSASKSIVRATYAACIATLANCAAGFLDMLQALKADGSLPSIDPETEDGDGADATYQALFDVARTDLVDYFEQHTKSLLTDDEPSVRRAFLGSVSSLCVFFGSAKASEVILSHLNTYLNDKDWMLKCAFFEIIVGVGTFVGSRGLEEFILPLMVQSLSDPEDFIVEKVIRSLASLADLGLFQRLTIWELVDVHGRFSMHPNIWIREAALSLVSSATRYLSPADSYCIIVPLMRPFLRYVPTDLSELKLLDALKRPLSRPVFDMAISWAQKVNKGIFWVSAAQSRTAAGSVTDLSIPITSARELEPNVLSRMMKNEEDEQWLSRLRSVGLSAEDEPKLVALRQYLWRVALSKPKEGVGSTASHLNNVITLKQLGIIQKIISFKEDQRSFGKPSQGGWDHRPARGPSTISEALFDASMTIDSAPPRQRQTELATGNGARIGIRQKQTKSSSPSPPSAADSARPPAPTSEPDAGRGMDHRRQTLSVRPTSGSLRRQDSLAPVDTNGGGRKEPQRGMRHKTSAVSLLNRTESTKAFAETGTTAANAFGKVEGPHLKEQRPRHPQGSVEDPQEQTAGARPQSPHDYGGSDPNVLHLLDAVYREQYPSDLVEFGPGVTPIARQQRIRRNTGELADSPWRPEGSAVALYGEHTSAINRVVLAPDHVFFITGSDDGTVKVWDSARLERNIAFRSRQTYKHAAGSKVKSLCFIENTHCFASAATDGTVQIVKVDYTQGGGMSRYGKLRLLKTYPLEDGEYAVWLEHFKAENHSVLLIATSHSRVLAVDIRTMRMLYSFANPVHHGALTSFCVDKKRAWLLLGTTHGILSLWDLRFQVRVKAWGLPGATPVRRLSVYPFRGRGRLVCVAGGCRHGEVTVWDIEKTQCREVYRVGSDGASSSGGRDRAKPTDKQYEAWKVDEDKPEGMLDRFATALEPIGTGSEPRGMRAFTAGMESVGDGRDSRSSGFLITAGLDQRVRFWDLNRIEGSMVVSGIDLNEAPRPTFVSSQPTLLLVVNLEKSAPQAAPSSPGAGGGAGGGGIVGNEGAGVKSAAAAANSSAKRANSGRPPRSTVISLQQQRLLTAHLDSILDVALLEWPYGMIVSVDRSGAMFVFR
ncbi:MAG: Serine/threonine-protein kinase [Phylliscum demangeonii]|nr:MAG: Serine/threonine-protein kinase [Phylliscum demangeonii]